MFGSAESLKTYKIAIVGEAGVGKSSLVERIVRDRFMNDRNATVGAAFSTYKQICNDEEVTYQIWDTAGQERYKALIPMYLRHAHIMFIVYDVTSSRSVERMIEHWFTFVYKNSNIIKDTTDNKDYVIIMIGNKCDLQDELTQCDERIIKSNIEKAEEMVTEYDNVKHILVSAKTGKNIDEILEKIKNFVIEHESRSDGYATDGDYEDEGSVVRITKKYWDSVINRDEEENMLYGCVGKCNIV
jgi:small GTP-binding protein